VNGGYLAEQVPDWCSDGHAFGWSESSVRSSLVVQMGRPEWSLTGNEDLTDDEIIKYVIAFYKIVSFPPNNWYHEHCENQHYSDFQETQGRYNYTIRINAAFERINTSYFMSYGEITRFNSSTLAIPLSEKILIGGDLHL